jgi:hypothetical protein
MKKIFMCIFSVFISSAKPGETVSITKINPPEFTYGGIKGGLIPVPSYAIIKAYNDDMNSVVYRCYADETGHFKLANVIPGNYHIIIAYVPNMQGTVPEPMPYLYFEVRGIVVGINMVTELGDIQLIK